METHLQSNKGGSFGEELKYRRESGNQVDRYAVAVVKDKMVFSHALSHAP